MSSRVGSPPKFSLASANKTLPLVRAIVTDIVELYRDVKEREERLSNLKRDSGNRKTDRVDPYSEEVDQVRADLERDVERLQCFVDELSELGVEFKDPVMGLVDFPATKDGEDVYLCWKLGEPTIAHWHTLDSGFSGRQTIEGSLS